MNTYEIRNKIKQGHVPTWPEAVHMAEELEKIEESLAETERRLRLEKIRQGHSDIIG